MDIRRLLPPTLSLKTRFSIAAALLTLFIAAVMTTAAVLIVQRGTEQVVRDGQVVRTGQIAGEVNQHVLLRQNALARLAGDFERRNTGLSGDFQSRMDHFHALNGLFSNVFMLNRGGDVVADMVTPSMRSKGNFSTRSYFIDTLRRNGPVLSEPMISLVSNQALVMLTAPVRDATGRIAYVLVGLIDLERAGFMRNMASSHPGRTGYVFMLSAQGAIMAHPDGKLLLHQARSSAAALPELQRALEGAQAPALVRLGDGSEALVTVATVPLSGWRIAAVYPTAEAYASTGTVAWYASLLAGLMVLVIAPVAWLLIRRHLRPLQQLAARMRNPRWSPAAAYSGDELGELARAFDQVMAERQRAGRAIADSERTLRLVADNVPALVAYVDSNRNFVFGNERYQAIFGSNAQDIAGKSVREVVGADVYAVSELHMEAALRGEAARFERSTMRDGALHWDRVAYNPDIDAEGTVRGYIALVDDISELKATQIVLAASEKRIRTITDNMPVLIGYIDTDLRYRFCNSGYSLHTGLPLTEILGRTVAEVFGVETHDSLATNMAAALRGERVSFEHSPPTPLGRFILQYDYIPDIGPDGKVVGFYAMVQNITAHKDTEVALRTQKNLLRSVADNLPALVNYMDADGRILFANRHHEHWTGRGLDDIVGALATELLTPEEAAAHQHFFDKALQGSTARWSFARQLGGELRHYECTYISQQGLDGALGITCLVNDVTDAKRIERQLSELARFDALTGLPNRMQLVERISRAIVRSGRNGARLAVLYLDLDKFKTINDSFGHSGGDAVLCEFGRRLKACVRQSDTVGRLAGDEFVILLEGLQNEAECQLVAGKIIGAMEKPFDIDGVARIVTTSVGVASALGPATSVDALLKLADDALYRAKEKGRNRYAVTALN